MLTNYRFQILPPVVKNLLIINVLLFISTGILQNININLNEILGLHYWKSDLFRPWQIVTYMFMHGNTPHIFFNMFAVWMFGTHIENRWGSKRFLNYYLLTGFGAALLHYLIFHFYTLPNVPSIIYTNTAPLTAYEYILQNSNVVGASGSLFGILLAFGVLFPNTLLYLYFAIPIKAKYFVIGYGLIELFSGLSNNPNNNVAHFAHLGGMLFGLMIFAYWKIKNEYY